MLLKYDQRQPLGGGMSPMAPQAVEGSALLSGTAGPPRLGSSPSAGQVATATPPSLKSDESGPSPSFYHNATMPSLPVVAPSLPSLPPPLELVDGQVVSDHIPIEDKLRAQQQLHDLGGTKASMEKLEPSVSGDGGATTTADIDNEKGESDEKKLMIGSV
mmetsp:Transcript_12249/g.27197  ORF Transcript_12249/g.27197 Transcript_12249/m.27197 type:complete len:160 (-) Transcript_12249:151-630(-)